MKKIILIGLFTLAAWTVMAQKPQNQADPDRGWIESVKKVDKNSVEVIYYQIEDLQAHVNSILIDKKVPVIDEKNNGSKNRKVIAFEKSGDADSFQKKYNEGCR